MTYINMDHAGWVQSMLTAAKKRLTKADLRIATEQHRGWGAAPDELNTFHKRGFNILGIVAGGIYNAPISWKGVYWDSRTLGMAWRGSFATFDFDRLTWFAMLCHEARIRGEISPLSPAHLEVSLHERKSSGGMSRSHPNLDEAVTAFRAQFPTGHSIVYRENSEAAA
jgi:hypothetical protein